MLEYIHYIDLELFKLINQSCSSLLLDDLMPILRDKKTWFPFYIGIVFFLIYKYKYKGLIIVVFIGLTIVISDQLSSQILKYMFERIRPCQDDILQSQIKLLISCSQGYSFPSSHATNHFAFATFIALLFKNKTYVLPVVMFLWAGLISFAQVYVGVHYPLDIIAGAGLGIFIGYIYSTICKKILTYGTIYNF